MVDKYLSKMFGEIRVGGWSFPNSDDISLVTDDAISPASSRPVQMPEKHYSGFWATFPLWDHTDVAPFHASMLPNGCNWEMNLYKFICFDSAARAEIRSQVSSAFPVAVETMRSRICEPRWNGCDMHSEGRALQFSKGARRYPPESGRKSSSPTQAQDFENTVTGAEWMHEQQDGDHERNVSALVRAVRGMAGVFQLTIWQ